MIPIFKKVLIPLGFIFIALMGYVLHQQGEKFSLDGFILNISIAIFSIIITVGFVDYIALSYKKELEKKEKREKEAHWNPARGAINKIIIEILYKAQAIIIFNLFDYQEVEKWADNNDLCFGLSYLTEDTVFTLAKYSSEYASYEQLLSSYKMTDNYKAYEKISRELLGIESEVQKFLSYSHDSLHPHVLSGLIQIMSEIKKLNNHIYLRPENKSSMEELYEKTESAGEKMSGYRKELLNSLLPSISKLDNKITSFSNKKGASLVASILRNVKEVYSMTQETENKKFTLT